MIQKPAGGGKSAPTRKTVRLMVKKPMDSLLIIFFIVTPFLKNGNTECTSPRDNWEAAQIKRKSEGSSAQQFLDCRLDYDVT